MQSIKEFVVSLKLNFEKLLGFHSFEIYIEEVKSQNFRSQLDGRGRWVGEVLQQKSDYFLLQVILYLSGNRHSIFSDTVSLLPDAAELAQTLYHQALSAPATPYSSTPFRLENTLKGLEIWDLRFRSLDNDSVKEIIDWNMEAVRSVSSRARSKHFDVDISECYRYYFSPKLPTLKEECTNFHLYGYVVLQTKPIRYLDKHIYSRHFADIAGRPISVGLVRKLESGERLITLPKEKYLLVLDPEVVAPFILAFLPAFDGELVASGKSFVSNRIGEVIGSRRVHIIDDATIQNGVETRGFDMRGVPPLPLTLIKEGVLDCVYVSPRLAKQRRIRPTGHQGMGNKLWSGNIIVKSGRRSLNMILSDEDTALIATHLVEPININLETGDFELVAHFIQHGPNGKKGRIGPARIQSNLFSFLPKVIETANNQNRVLSVDVSSWVLEDITIDPIAEVGEPETS